ncbi:MAG: toll/interleukin-1 receptor domain-containing protein [Dissulfurispiraceae bacterium]
METYRVFISYSHEDRELAEIIVNALKENGLKPMWDKNFNYGQGFHVQIKNFIAHSHVFMPFITETSSRRGWVHQEIGFATALNVPVLPITRGQVPGELLQQLLAVPFSSDAEELRSRLNLRVFEKLVSEAQGSARPLFYCAEYREDRTRMMVEYSKSVLHLEEYGRVRQKGGLSSFHIPDKSPQHSEWKDRFGAFYDESHCLLQREERKTLEKHARKEGCSLIIDPYIDFQRFGSKAGPSRLKSLIEFLESKVIDDIVVSIVSPEQRDEHYLTIVGDWFASEAVSASLDKGIRQTIFTRHAPSIRKRIEAFDEEVEHHLKEQGVKPECSKKAAIAKLQQLLTDLNNAHQ